MTAAPLAPDDVGALWDRMIGLAERLDADDRSRPTPCPEWDVRDLLLHCSGLQTMFDGGPQPDPPDGWAPPEGRHPRDAWTAAGVAARRDWSWEQVLTELRAAREGHVARLRAVTDWDAETVGPTGPTTEAGLVTVRCFDLWVHVQDLLAALGQPLELDDTTPAAEACHRFVVGRVPIIHAKVVGAPEGSALALHLGAPLEVDTTVVVRDGRAAFDDGAPAAADEVTASPAALTLLLSGREDETHWQQLGELDWSGDLGEAFVARARMF